VSVSILSQYITLLLLITAVTSLVALLAAPWCKTHLHAALVTGITPFIHVHCKMYATKRSQ
jgi:hypothetical protein